MFIPDGQDDYNDPMKQKVSQVLSSEEKPMKLTPSFIASSIFSFIAKPIAPL